MNKKLILWLVIIVVAILGIIWLARTPSKPGELDEFAQCLTESGAKYYGAFWCPNCKNQEAMFGRSAKLLPRIECSTPDGKSQLPVCQEAKITGYPTWDFADGTRVTGTQGLESLSEKTNCPLPAQAGLPTE
ncbi:MAG: hypothetical protein AAB690_01460 [Patescibacteria group bacterium]